MARISSLSLWTLVTVTTVQAFVPTKQASHANIRIISPPQMSLYGDYLSSLSSNSINPSAASSSSSSTTITSPSYATPSTSVTAHVTLTEFAHAPLSYFSKDLLTPKGPRVNADVGQPHDATRQLYDDDIIATGSWWCAHGGWPSLKQRTSTEIFYVLEGHGCLTDLDGMKHYFGPGDIVILPKGWSGRWDVLEDIHKVWFVHEHPHIEEHTNPIRVRIIPYAMASPQYMVHKGIRPDATHGTPNTASSILYDVGPTEVGFWTCTPGSFPVQSRSTTECFYVMEGVFFLTNADGSARRCQAGDTVVLPKGWSGYWDVIETVKKLWVVV